MISGASAAYYLSTEQGKKVTKKVVRFVKDYQEDPQEVHESVKQTAKDVSKQAAEVIQQTKEKVGSGEITTGTVLESGNDLVQSIRKQTESEDIVLELDEKNSEEAAEEETKEA